MQRLFSFCFLVSALIGCGGGPAKQASSPDEPVAKPAERPYSEVGSTLRRALKERLGIDTITRTPATLTLQGEAHAAGDPIAIVVHGIDPVRESFDPLIAYLQARGLRVYYFAYDDQQDLDASAFELGVLAGQLVERLPTARIWVVAHSMGGLVSRRAHIQSHQAGLTAGEKRFTLVTIASPFGGFLYADGARYDMGFGHDSWQDVGTTCAFVSQPGDLASTVTHFKLETNEAGKTRLLNGKRAKDDAVSFENQRQTDVDDQAERTLELDLGHVGCLLDPSGELPSATRAALDDVLR